VPIIFFIVISICCDVLIHHATNNRHRFQVVCHDYGVIN